MKDGAATAPPDGPSVTVNLSFLGSLRTQMGTATDVVTVPAPASVRGVVEALIGLHGHAFSDLFYNQYGWLDPRVLFVVDGESVVSRQGLDTPLSGHEEIDVFLALPMSGG